MLVESMVSEGILERCFIPTRRLRKKFQGAWHEVTEKLFPGYVFLITEQPQLLYEELKQIPRLTRMLGRCEEYFVPLPEADVKCRPYLMFMPVIIMIGTIQCVRGRDF